MNAVSERIPFASLFPWPCPEMFRVPRHGRYSGVVVLSMRKPPVTAWRGPSGKVFAVVRFGLRLFPAKPRKIWILLGKPPDFTDLSQ